MVEIIRPTWVRPGAASLRSCSHFPIREYSRLLKPVMLPLGRARLWTNPCSSGSETVTNTIGIVRVSFCSGINAFVGPAKMTSGLSWVSSAPVP